jgi:nitroreductase
MTHEALRAIRTCRVVRRMTAEPIDREQVITILNAGRWAPSGGNRRLHRFVAVQRPVTRRSRRMVSPGMLQHPTAAVVICTDRQRIAAYRIPPEHGGGGGRGHGPADHVTGRTRPPWPSESEATIDSIVVTP